MKSIKYLTCVAMVLATLILIQPMVHAETLNLIYDANGNLVSGDGKYREYNSLNQLAKVYNGTGDSGTLLQEYQYHPTEERVHVKVKYNSDGSNETTIYVSENYVRVLNDSGSFDYTYVYHNGQQVAQVKPSGTEFIHGDHIGSSSVVTNESGEVIENTTYAPFGKIFSGGEQTRYNYEGKEHDETGLIDFGARMYNPETQLFIQPDTLVNDVYNPQALNRYMFELGNPYKNTDPTGHFAWDNNIFSDTSEAWKWGNYNYFDNMWLSANEAWNSNDHWQTVVLREGLKRTPYLSEGWDIFKYGMTAAQTANGGYFDTPKHRQRLSNMQEDAAWSSVSLGISFLPEGNQVIDTVKDVADYYQYGFGSNIYQDTSQVANNFVSRASSPYTKEVQDRLQSPYTPVYRRSRSRQPNYCPTCSSGRDYNEDMSGYYDYDKQQSVWLG